MLKILVFAFYFSFIAYFMIKAIQYYKYLDKLEKEERKKKITKIQQRKNYMYKVD